MDNPAPTTSIVELRPGAIESYTTRFTPSQVALIRATYARDCNDDEFAVYLYQSQRRGLDPSIGQIHAVVRGRGEDRKMVIQTGIGGFRLIAQRTGRYVGRLGPYWCGEDGVWKDVWLRKDHPFAAKVGVRTTTNPEGSWAVATWAEMAQYTREGKLNHFWDTMGPLMIAKCAESSILRVEFPEELSGLYIDEEMMQADNPPRQMREGASTATSTQRPVRTSERATASPETELEATEKRLWREAKALDVKIPPLGQNPTIAQREARADWLEARIAYRNLTPEAESVGVPVPKLAEPCSRAQILAAMADVRQQIDAAAAAVAASEPLFPTGGDQ